MFMKQNIHKIYLKKKIISNILLKTINQNQTKESIANKTKLKL